MLVETKLSRNEVSTVNSGLTDGWEKFTWMLLEGGGIVGQKNLEWANDNGDQNDHR